ncbi:MAG TPA: rod shape-determining protein MreC [Bacteroidales bacterium]|nr:rod shape-determining protein MreC [Bacteroidales bacterium]HQH14173.1 rod shape-determining protein MreC [Bacteroidales bacterium]
MQNLFAFIWKNSFYFLFVLLLVLSVVLMARNNYYHRTVMINTTNEITGGILLVASNFSDYMKLKRTNRELAEENAKLISQTKELFLDTSTKAIPYPDSNVLIPQYEFIAAKVISNSVNRRNNYIKLDKGRFQGIMPNMAVISPAGIVGHIVEVSNHFSSVMSVLNRNSRISAKHKTSNHVGSLLWDGIDYRFGKLVDLPSHVKIFQGDTIVTSGYSHLYPEGVIIGTVQEAILESGASFYNVTVSFSTDFNRLSYVYVVNNLFYNELDSLQQLQPQNEPLR